MSSKHQKLKTTCRFWGWGAEIWITIYNFLPVANLQIFTHDRMAESPLAARPQPSTASQCYLRTDSQNPHREVRTNPFKGRSRLAFHHQQSVVVHEIPVPTRGPLLRHRPISNMNQCDQQTNWPMKCHFSVHSFPPRNKMMDERQVDFLTRYLLELAWSAYGPLYHYCSCLVFIRLGVLAVI